LPQRPALRRIACVALASAPATLLLPGTARAQANPIAEQLFHEGQALLAEGKVHEACERLSASYGLEAGLGTLLNLAVCHEREARTATAWTEFTEAAARAEHAGDAERQQFARLHADTLAKSMKRAVIRLAGPVEGTTVKLDGRELPAAALGVPIPLDPGSHAIEVSAPQKATYRGQFATGADPIIELSVPPLVALETPAATPEPSPSASVEMAAPRSPRSGRRTAGFVVGGAGIAALGVAGYLGLRALSLSSTAVNEKNRSNNTPGDFADANQAQTDHQSALSSQLAGFVVGGVGAACLASGLYLVLTGGRTTAPPSAALLSVVPELAPGRAGAVATVRW
jgi:hypothetical protein